MYHYAKLYKVYHIRQTFKLETFVVAPFNDHDECLLLQLMLRGRTSARAAQDDSMASLHVYIEIC